jgi:hypothetical protein
MREKRTPKIVFIVLAIALISIFANVMFVIRFETLRREHIHGLQSNLRNLSVLTRNFAWVDPSEDSGEDALNFLIIDMTTNIMQMHWGLHALESHHNRRFLSYIDWGHGGFWIGRLNESEIRRYLCIENHEHLADAMLLQSEYIEDFIRQISIDEADVHPELLQPNERLSTRRFFSEFNTLVEVSVTDIWGNLLEDLAVCPF